MNTIKTITQANLKNETEFFATIVQFLEDDINYNAFCATFAKRNDGILPKPKGMKTVCVYDLAHNNSNKLTIHEIVHVITSQLVQSNLLQPKTFKLKSGIMYSEYKQIRNLDFKGDIRQILTNNHQYAYQDLNIESNCTGRFSREFNEILVDYFAYLATQKYEKKGVGDLGLDNSPSLYSRGFPFVKDFIERHKKLFAKILMSKDPKFIEKLFGTQRLCSLNSSVSDAFTRIIENLGGYETFAMMVEETIKEKKCTYEKAVGIIGKNHKEYDEFASSIRDVLSCERIITRHIYSLMKNQKQQNEEEQL